MYDRLVLIADTDGETRRLFSAVLAAQQYRTVTADNADQAITIARTEHPELIVADLALPHRDGFAVVQQLKSDPATASIPVLAVTGQPHPELHQSARSAGCDALLIKPVTGTTLSDVGRLLIERAELLRQRSVRLRGTGAAEPRPSDTPTAVGQDAAAPAPEATDHPKCRRCGSDADCRLVRTTRSSVTYYCGVCQQRWRLTFKDSTAR